MKNVQLILGTMTFGESVFSPEVGEFVNTFLDSGYRTAKLLSMTT